MVIALSNSYTHKAPCAKTENIQSNDLKDIVIGKLRKIGINQEDVGWNKSGHLEIKSSNSMKVHSLLLQMEKLGLDVKLTKQTLIEIA